MCLTTNQLKPLIAEKDIKCFKVLKITKDRLSSLYYKFLWIKGKVERTGFSMNIWGNQIKIANGFHAYTTEQAMKGSFYYLMDVNIDDSYICKEFIIPKGSKYYVSSYGREIVSNQMKMI